MVSILAALVSLAFGLFIGQSELLLVVLVGFVLLGIFYLRSAVFALLCFLSILAINTFAIRDYPVFFFYIGSIVLLRCVFKARLPKIFQFVWVPVLLALGISSQVQPLLLIVTIILITFTVPIKSYPASRVQSGSKRRTLLWLLSSVALLTAVVGWSYYGLPKQIRYSAILDNGHWAKSSEKYSLSKLNISSAYSYSEFADLISATSLDVDRLDRSIDELWIITPTTPFSEIQKLKLFNWVKQGGHLILLTDHTDLYGHARVANSFLNKFGIFTSLTATFSNNKADYADDSFVGKFKLMTGTSIGGRGIWPTLTGLWYEENAYYGNPNFFGPLRLSGDDKFTRLVLSGKKQFGLGHITVLADSTPFANFAVYQPGTPELILKLRQVRLYPAIYPHIPFLLLILCILALALRCSIPFLMIPLLGMTALINCKSPDLNWGNNIELWSGDRSLVMGVEKPEYSFSTAFSIAALSGKKPMWVDHVLEKQHGIWVSRTQPPNPKWKWISPEINNSAKVQLGPDQYQPLLNYLRAPYPFGWEHLSCQGACPSYICAGYIWTNDVMGDWWFDRGLSPSRTRRFQAFLALINDQPLPPEVKPVEPSKVATTWLVKANSEDKAGQLIKFPIPSGAAFWKEPVLLGRGISAQGLIDNSKVRIVGLKSFNEAWGSPEMWLGEKQ